VWVEGRAKQARERGVYLAGVYNGAAGICGLLGASIDAGVAVERARALLEPALRALLERSVANEDPAAWHDGTLGIAAVAFVAARAAGLDHWQERALAIASRVARAAPRTRDASIFWGAAGAAHMFYRLYDATGQEVFADATRRYLASLLRRRRSNESGLAGFRTYRYAWERDFLGKPDYPVGWIGRPGILQGVAGIGLVLLAILHADEPAWDRCLLLSHRASQDSRSARSHAGSTAVVADSNASPMPALPVSKPRSSPKA
jgi:hypothetical protein